MASKNFQFNMDDLKRWGWTVLAGVIATVLDIIALQIIPALEQAGGPTNAAIVAVATLLIDLVRRYLADTRKVTPTEAQNIIVKKDGFLSSLKKLFGGK